MTDTRRQGLPIFIVGRKHKGPLISLVARLLIVAAVTVSISVVVAILLIQKFGATWNVVPVMAFAIVVPAAFAVAVNYLYWRPKYRAL